MAKAMMERAREMWPKFLADHHWSEQQSKPWDHDWYLQWAEFFATTLQAEARQESAELLLCYGFTSVLCGQDGKRFYECRECRNDEGHDHPATSPETAKHKEGCKLAAAIEQAILDKKS